MFPAPETARRELELAAQATPGLWVRHSQNTGEAARRIAARHGGSIVFEQRENRGSRAIVTLPIRQAEGTPLLRTPAMGYDARGGFSDLLVELANVLPFEAFLPKHLE